MPPPKPSAPFALFLDVDGTLIDIAPTPDAVVVPEDLKRTLSALAEQLDGALALVSGRTIADLDRLFEPLRLRASGVHGAEIRFDPAAAIESLTDASLPDDVIDALHAMADRIPGVLVEDKHFSAAVHFRAAPTSEPQLRRRLEALVAASAGGSLRILPGHMVFEIKRSGFDKGVAIGRMLGRAPFAGRTPVFLGDDVTDEPGFATVAGLGGLAVAVGVERPAASSLLASPRDVRHWLASLVENASAS